MSMSAKGMVIQPRSPSERALSPRPSQQIVAPLSVPSRNRCENKRRQAQKIRAIGEALTAEGYGSLAVQAEVLGLCRSTAWTIIKANHKTSGLTAATINRMLAAPGLPQTARLVVLEYIEEKVAGLYGDDKSKIRRFIHRVSVKQMRSPRAKLANRV